MNDKTASEVFENMPVPKAVLKNTLPAMAAMLMVLVYNLADTFFIGRTHNDILVAAVSLATPVFLIFLSVGNVFGIGGTSVISRALGRGEPEYAKRVCSFCMWACVATGVALSAAFLIFMDEILTLIGGSSDTWDPAKTYLTIVSYCGPLVLVSSAYSNIIRAEGQPGRAMMGQIMGNLLNIVLDPVMILLFNWGIAGAAIATVIGNTAAAVYYIAYFLRGKSTLSIHPRDFRAGDGICANVLAIGIPASLGSIMVSVSHIVVNAQMASYGDMELAGNGVAMKVTLITGMICIGLGQGIQPLLGYCVGARLWERFRRVMRFSLVFALLLGTGMTLLCYLLRSQLVGAFLTEPAAFEYAVRFTNILLTTSFLFGVFFVFSNSLQAMGAAVQALITNLSRQGIIYIPALFVLRAAFGVNGLVWAQPAADLLSMVLVASLYLWTSRKMMKNVQ